MSATSEDEGESDIGTKGVPEDVCEKCKECGECIKDENGIDNEDHTNVQYL